MKLSYELLNLRREEPFVSSKGSKNVVDLFLVRLEHGSNLGLGTAVIANDYGMSESLVRAALQTCAGLVNRALALDSRLIDDCKAAVPGLTSAVAAVDMALHDLLGQIAGLPLHRYFGLAGLPLSPTSVSIGFMEDEERLNRVRKLGDWPILKIKVSGNNYDIVARIREIYNGRLWIDGNGSFDCTQAITAAQLFHRYDVELFEQPIGAGNPETLRFIRQRSPVPLVADEDCRDLQDVQRLEGCVDVVNIKLVKCGGLKAAMEMIKTARDLGLRVMLGCKVESIIGITALGHIAGLADYVELDGHFGLQGDNFTGIAIDHGRVILPTLPGLGVVARTP